MVTSNGQKVTELKAVLQELNETVKERGGINGVSYNSLTDVSKHFATCTDLYAAFVKEGSTVYIASMLNWKLIYIIYTPYCETSTC